MAAIWSRLVLHQEMEMTTMKFFCGVPQGGQAFYARAFRSRCFKVTRFENASHNIRTTMQLQIGIGGTRVENDV